MHFKTNLHYLCNCNAPTFYPLEFFSLYYQLCLYGLIVLQHSIIWLNSNHTNSFSLYLDTSQNNKPMRIPEIGKINVYTLHCGIRWWNNILCLASSWQWRRLKTGRPTWELQGSWNVCYPEVWMVLADRGPVFLWMVAQSTLISPMQWKSHQEHQML